MEEEIKKITEKIENLILSFEKEKSNSLSQENSKKISSALRSFIFKTTSSKILKILSEENLPQEEINKLENIKITNFELFSPSRGSLPSYADLIEKKAEVNEIFSIILDNEYFIE